MTTEGSEDAARSSTSKQAKSPPRSIPISTARTWSRSRRLTIVRSSPTSAPVRSRSSISSSSDASRTLRRGEGTEGIAISPDQREVWAANRGGNTVSIIDVASAKVVATLALEVIPDPREVHRRRQARPRLQRAVGRRRRVGRRDAARSATHQDAVSSRRRNGGSPRSAFSSWRRCRGHSSRIPNADSVAVIDLQDVADRRLADGRQGAGRPRLLADRSVADLFCVAIRAKDLRPFAYRARRKARRYTARPL